MPTNKAKQIVRSFARKLARHGYRPEAVYLFGSYAKNRQHKWSDIDVAVVSGKLRRNYERNRLLLWKMRHGVDLRIEPHGFTPEDFADEANPMAYEIRQTGSRII